MCTRALCAAVLLLPVLPHASWLDVDPEGDEVPEIYMRTRPRARSHIATDLSDGEMNTFSTIRSRARYFNLTGVEIVDNSDSGHDYPFNMPSWPGIGPFLSDGVTRRSFSRLNLDKQANDESVRQNNLGGVGPNNGKINPDRYDLNFILLDQVTTNRDGSSVSMRIDNTSVYRPWNPGQNSYHQAMFQINLQPIFDVTSTLQPFDFTADLQPLIAAIVREQLQAIGILDLVDLNASNTNSVGLFYSFFHTTTGLPVELEEVRARPTCQRHAYSS